MAELKLPKLPDRTPVKMTIVVSPDLSNALAAYAEAYEKTYGRAEAVTDIVPFMLQAFLESDRAFGRMQAKSA